MTTGKIKLEYDASGLYGEDGSYVLDGPEEFNIQSMTLVAAVRAGDLDKVESLLADPKTDVNTTATLPLRIACGMGRLDIVKVLLKHGAQIVHEENDEALLSAILGGHVKTARYLALKCKFSNKLLFSVLQQLKAQERVMEELISDMCTAPVLSDEHGK